jgi:hypothetical protein
MKSVYKTFRLAVVTTPWTSGATALSLAVIIWIICGGGRP